MAKKKAAGKTGTTGRRVVKKKVKVSKRQQAMRVQRDPVLLRKASGASIASLMASLETKEGGIAGLVSDAWRGMIGIPLPAFSLEYLFDMTIIPLEKVIGIRGLPKTKKSALAFEMFRWTISSCGLGSLIEHESKFNSSWAASVVGWDDDEIGRLGVAYASSIDEWQTWVQDLCGLMKRRMTGTKEEPGFGTGLPYTVIVDSIMGKSTEETQLKLARQGSITRNFPAEALNIRNFMMAFPQKMVGWPFLLIFVNHNKPKQNDQGFTVDSVPGGYAPQFQLSVDIKVTRKKDINQSEYRGTNVQLQTMFNSFGQDKRKVVVDCTTQIEDATDPFSDTPYRDRTIWNWYKATTELLLEVLAEDSRGKAAVQHFKLKKAKNRMCYSTVLGVPSTAPISYQAMGQRIQNNPEALAFLRRHFGIKQCKKFRAAVPYAEQKKEATIIQTEDVYASEEATDD